MNAQLKPLRVAVLKVVNLPQWSCCTKCHTPRKHNDLVSGICIHCEPELISEQTHMECPNCREMKIEFDEVEVKSPLGNKFWEICTDCAYDFYTDKDFGWTDRE